VKQALQKDIELLTLKIDLLKAERRIMIDYLERTKDFTFLR
jgi:hypothetical protein